MEGQEGYQPPSPHKLRKHLPLREWSQYPLFDHQRHILMLTVEDKAEKRYAAEGHGALPGYINSQWTQVTMHDARGIVSLMNGYNEISPFFPDNTYLQGFSQMFSHMQAMEHDLCIPSETLLEQSNLLINYARKNLTNKEFSLPPEVKYMEKTIERAKVLARIWRMLYYSSKFLNSLSKNDMIGMDKHFGILKNSSFFAGDIVKKAGRNNTTVTGLRRHQQIDGVKGIILHNLLKNAETHKAKDSKVEVVFNGDAITISNDSRTPFPERSLDHPGEPGPKGNTGYGVFISKNIFGLLGGYDVVLNSGTTKDGGHPYRVSFTIKPSESLPLPKMHV
ncbi:MAG: ATP-binding protein [bacterium]